MRRTSKALVGLWLILAIMLVAQPKASAHAFVVEISPEPDSVLGQAPKRISIAFNEPVSGTASSIRLFDPSGRQVSGIKSQVQDSKLSAELPSLGDVGSYTVAWKVVSADGHPINGAFLFSVGKATLSEPLDVAASTPSVFPRGLRTAGSLASWAGLVMLLAFVGISARSKTNRGGIATSTVLLVVGAAVSLTGSLLAVGGSIADSVSVTLDTSSGRVSVGALVLAAVVGLIVWQRVRSAERLGAGDRRLIIGLGLCTAIVIALEGHSLGLSPVVLSALLTPLHVVAAVIWLAGLVWIDRRARIATVDEVRADVTSRSPYAMVTVAVLAGTGIGLFALRMPMDQLLGSAYGIIGSIKIILLSMAVVLAWQNRNTMALRKDTPTGAEVEQDEVDLETSHRNALDLRRFKATLRVEVVLVSVALLLGTVLAQVSPPGLDPATGGYFGQKLPFGTGKVELTVEPGKRGVNEIHVTALGSDGRLMADIYDLKLELHLPEKDLGPLVPSLQVITRGHSYTFARIPFGGDWKFTVTATVNRFDELSATFDVPIAN